MNTTSPYIAMMRSALIHPERGVVGMVDDLLTVCAQHVLQLDWQADRCRVRTEEGEWEELIDLPMRKSVFRAILARMAVLCNEREPNSVSPYGGLGTIPAGSNSSTMLRVSFVNSPAEQRLEIQVESNAADESTLRRIASSIS